MRSTSGCSACINSSEVSLHVNNRARLSRHPNSHRAATPHFPIGVAAPGAQYKGDMMRPTSGYSACMNSSDVSLQQLRQSVCTNVPAHINIAVVFSA